MTTRRIFSLLLPLLLLTACAAEEPVILAEPVMEESAAARDCEPAETDGIGGTGCEPDTN